MKTGEKIRFYRTLKNYTQEYMADELKLSQRAYSKIENDEVQLKIDRLEEIAKLLNVDANQLLPGSPYLQIENANYSQIGNGKIINYVSEKERELYEKLLQKQQEEINQLKSVIEELKQGRKS